MVASGESTDGRGAKTASSLGSGEVAGRASEVAALRAALADALAGRGRLTWIAGEAGVGKTRLAESLAEDAFARGANVLWGRCWEDEDAPDLWPWVQVVRTCLRSVDEGVLRTLVGPHSSELTALVSAPPAASPERAAAGAPPAKRFRLFNAVAHLLDEYSRLAPLVVILEDLQWGDPQSLRLLQFFTQEQRQRPMLLAATYREPSASTNAALTPTVVEAMREPGTERIDLGGLDDLDTQALLSALVGVAAPADFAEEVQRRTGGNPLFITECARQISIGSGEAAWPRAQDLYINAEMAELIDRRLTGLSAHEHGVLRRAASLGCELGEDALLQLAADDDGGAEPREQTVAAIRSAERRGLLARGPRAGMLRFVQTMVRERLLEGASGEHRPEAVGAPPPTDAAMAPAPNTDEAGFRKEGEYWTITFAGRTCRVRDAKGLAYVALLLRHPGKPMHATEVVHLGNGGAPGAKRSVPFDESTAVRSGLGDAGALLDRQAKDSYKRRLAELQSEVEEAREFNDAGGAERALREIEFLTDELSAAVGLGGRDRRAGSDAERARVNVTRSISRAIQKLDSVHPELARHLTQTIRTGTFCTYVAEPSTARTWDL